MAFEMKPFNNSLFDMSSSDMFKDFGRRFFADFPKQGMKTDIREVEDFYVVEAELPGIDKENINIEFNSGILTIEGQQSVDNEAKDENGKVIHSERSYNNIKRQFNFEHIDETGISANFDHGILNITLPKSNSETSSKHIEIQ
ncbi:Hsp20/alpha crystallin family protein [Salinicoccus albus]|uniref:Hsp20/alpha crystallin family protein n=1 Tax=Salinicoccus albus TaxID=418756 RepID=UPI000372EF1A|nr:Hsp20/alpha crystallin family protein [Salinicoccus albus]